VVFIRMAKVALLPSEACARATSALAFSRENGWGIFARFAAILWLLARNTKIGQIVRSRRVEPDPDSFLRLGGRTQTAFV
jgi:hypothetical protein